MPYWFYHWIAYPIVVSSIAGFALWVIAKSFRDAAAHFGRPERPVCPEGEDTVWYRGWECGWSRDADYWTGAGYYACKGGADLDCIQVTAGRWDLLLDEVDDYED